MTSDPRGLAGAWTRFQRHGFAEPSPALAPFVSGYWAVDWTYDEPYRQVIVPFPQVHLTWRDDAAPEVSGVATAHVVRVLEGTGRVFGVAFHPGGFRPFLRSPGSSRPAAEPVSVLTDRVVPAGGIPGLAATPPPRSPHDAAEVERWLLAAGPVRDPLATWVAGVVGTVAAEPGITRVDQLAERCGSSVRRLQRLFAEYVGVGPKWVVRRYRLREVTDRMAAGGRIDWARVAAELGYADQAHLTNDFTAVFGEPPTRYARRY